MKFTACVGLAFALPAVNALVFGGPTPTVTPLNQVVGTNPRPTKGPSVQELQARQNNASPQTCGFITGDLSKPMTCPNKQMCYMYRDTAAAMVGCCNGTVDHQNCGWARSCVELKSSAGCDASCQANTFIRKCYQPTASLCKTLIYTASGVTDYQCGATGGIFTVYPTGRAAPNVLAYLNAEVPVLMGNAVTGL